MDFLKVLRSYRGFKLRESGFPKFSVPPSGKTILQTVEPPSVSQVKECARGPLSACQVWWGLDFTSFFVCWFVCLTCLWMMGLWMTKFECTILPWRYQSTETVVIPLDKGRFVVCTCVNFLCTLMTCNQTWLFYKECLIHLHKFCINMVESSLCQAFWCKQHDSIENGSIPACAKLCAIFWNNL